MTAVSSGTVRRLQIFALEDRAVQVCWSALAVGDHRVRVGGRDIEVAGDGGPGALDIDGLEPGTHYEVVVADATISFRTLDDLGGPVLSRFASVSDLHLGEQGFGMLPRVRDGAADRPYPVRCLEAAVAEAVAWGAELLIVKGDIAHHASRDEYDVFCSIVTALPIPVVVVPGNHDGGNHVGVDPVEALARNGVELTTRVAVRDLPGVRIVVANSLVPGRGHGRLTPVVAEAIEAVRGAAGGAVLALHHHPQRTVVPTHWPPGILGLDGHRFLAGVQRANPATLITAGHTHRHRRRHHGPLVITEVGAPIHYPGTWAGYVAHDAGIRQVVRRIARPDVLAWTERTRRMGLGIWGLWSIGRLRARSFAHVWPERPGAA